MSPRAELRRPALLSALALGVLADLLVRTPGRPGLNIALWALAGVGVLVALDRRRVERAARETWWLVVGALGFAVAIMLRDAEALNGFCLLAAVTLLVLAAGRASAARAPEARVSEIAFAALRVAILCAAGPFGWGSGAPRTEAGGEGAEGWGRRALVVVRGTALAIPALVVLTALLMSADSVFAQLVRDTLHVDYEPFLEHLVFIGLIAWGTSGYLRAFLIEDDVVMGRLRVPRPGLSPSELSVALWLLNLLFIGFMAVQLRYLFGGAGLVEVTAGLSYADYARRGFFELIAAAALVVPILLLADWAASPEPPRARTVLRTTSLVLVLLLVGVIASAAYRMRLYQEAYGLTESRLYVSVIIVWLTVGLGWLVLTVLRGRRERFAFGAIIAGAACVAGLVVLNPHALIVRVNIDRLASGAEYDGAYLQGLGADAVPVLLTRLDRLPEEERCRVIRILVERWGGERRGGWRSWNLGDWRARRLVKPMVGTGGWARCSAMGSAVPEPDG